MENTTGGDTGGGVPPKSKLVLFSTVHKAVLARASITPVSPKLPELTPGISWFFLNTHRYFYYVPLARNISYIKFSSIVK